jgi:hypothetical protein
VAKCRLSDKHLQQISRQVGIPYISMYARGGWGATLEAWRDASNADQITRNRRKQPIAVTPHIRNGVFVRNQPDCWVQEVK